MGGAMPEPTPTGPWKMFTVSVTGFVEFTATVNVKLPSAASFAFEVVSVMLVGTGAPLPPVPPPPPPAPPPPPPHPIAKLTAHNTPARNAPRYLRRLLGI